MNKREIVRWIEHTFADAVEARGFVRAYSPELVRSLPGPASSLSEFAFQTVEAMSRREILLGFVAVITSVGEDS